MIFGVTLCVVPIFIINTPIKNVVLEENLICNTHCIGSQRHSNTFESVDALEIIGH